jgi:hypothetical protein
MHTMRISLVVVIVLMTPLAVEARQALPSIDIEGAWLAFPDEGIVNEPLIGGAARWHLTPRLSLGPEVVYIHGASHSHLVVTGNVVFDFRPDQSVQPFIVVGGGMFQTHEEFFDDAFTSREGAFTAGGGVRARLTDRVSAGLDARVGWEPHIRIGGVVCIRLGH